VVATPGARRMGGPRPRHRVRTAAVIGAIVLGVVLLVWAGVFLRSRPPGTGHGGSVTASAAASASPSTGESGAPGVGQFLVPEAAPAPPLDLVTSDARPFALADARGGLVLVFFGYTHCPDVCPATTGIVGQALRAYGPGARALFVTVDPERDTGEWLRDYARFLPDGFTALTGEAGAIRTAADAWGVRYARVDGERLDEYTMAHTADVFLVDAAGRLRARFPFGTDDVPMLATMRHVAQTDPTASPAASAALPSPGTTAGTTAGTSPSAPGPLALQPLVVSSSIWAQPGSPVILALEGPAGRVNDPATPVSVQLVGVDGTPVGGPVAAVAVQPPGTGETFFVASVDIPEPGAWRFEVTAQPGAGPLRGRTGLLTALDGGDTPAIGDPAPDTSTPTLADVGGDIRRLTTDPVPDGRLTERSTGEVLAAGEPFALVLDSYRFRATAACGRALNLAKQLVDRWRDVAFIHHEPYRYDIVTDTPVLEGSLTDPVLTDAARAWGIDGAPWDALSMPWVFIVDGHGTVRAKYQAVLGTADLDVILAQIAAEG
jgi:protein SCO1/2